MKIYFNGAWHTTAGRILIVKLEKKDKENIKNMDPDCLIYSEFLSSNFSIDYVKQLLEDVKKDGGYEG